MNNNNLDFYYTQLALNIMNKKDVLFDYIKKNPNKRKFELVNILVHRTKDMKDYTGDKDKDKRIMSYATLNKHLLSLKKIGRILQDKKTKTYSINPNYIEISEGSEEQLRLIFEKELDKIRDLQFLGIEENELWTRIYDKIKISYNFGEDLKDKLFFSNSISTLIGRLFISLLRECVIMNPELWYVMSKPEHFNFTFNLECNLQEDPNIFNLIKNIRKKCLDRGEVPINSGFPFRRNLFFQYSEDLQNLELVESKIENLKFKIDRSLEDLYYNAVGQNTLFKKEWEKEEKEKREDFEGYVKRQKDKASLDAISFYQKKEKLLGEKEEFKEFSKERQNELEKATKELQKKAKKPKEDVNNSK